MQRDRNPRLANYTPRSVQANPFKSQSLPGRSSSHLPYCKTRNAILRRQSAVSKGSQRGTSSASYFHRSFSFPSSAKPVPKQEELLTGSRDEREEEGLADEPVEYHNFSALQSIILHPSNILLIFLPFGVLASFLNWGAAPTFWFNFVAMIPLAKMLGDFTEELAMSLKNDIISGLVNASFGNAVEMIITVNALIDGNFEVVKATLLGSVLSNMLLVLGTSFLLGGLWPRSGREDATDGGRSADRYHPLVDGEAQEASAWAGGIADREQSFRTLGTLVSMTMLFVSCLSFALPTVYAVVSSSSKDKGAPLDQLIFSRVSAIIVFSSYIAYLIFTLVTHRKLLGEQEEEDSDDEDQEPGMSARAAVIFLFITTILVSICSEFVVDAIAGVVRGGEISTTFIGIILLPIVGNACEHAAAVRFAIMDMPGLAVGIAVGSSTQIALLVVPFAVLVGWVLDACGLNGAMDLNFGVLNLTVMTLSVLVVFSVVTDGRTNWLEGYMLVAAYALIGVMYYFLPLSM